MQPRTRHYLAFMLRMWQDSPEGSWRYLLEDVGTCQRYAFATLGELCAYLQLAANGIAVQRLPEPLINPPEIDP